ncbi:CusA/CzcA family heavy metal efflux RND transporter [Leeuwenhoekiella parthenopeia]|uniref:CusA/CzcA family heavy metal efflux RND transporter n=1 Tax=Leeuwenhoekiella parthenopeia TaxID=2890320 RepID=A0ABS8GN22_9FLAO|nr:CusA/CzcA family heavy metal efflux RND transporter [Leeuwenhoekiella parthenopeia]MCC4211314.1 CusA/CzcA family heavy metal efflux RND transporter [Leeuwenhoekiella parthenopeia]
MLSAIIHFSIRNKLIVLLFTFGLIAYGLYSLTQISVGAVPDVTNNQVQVITTSQNLSTVDMEQFITYPVELEMANLPGVKEIRSVSKFGLSVVTVVFEDDMGTYLPRQLLAEKIKSASEQIPASFGTPQMGPITTGLGEIYQYILDVKPGYEGKYSPTDLRSIQDWIVKRQLSGIPGVVEINTWGGYLKQYEVALNTQKLHAMNITAAEVFAALENNNSIAGGGYIEKENQAYFIRGEGLASSLEDIEQMVVKNDNGIPIYIRDVATVGFGHATRFGAITGNGEGEKVLGQVMMLKDANSKQVIDAVKQRVEEISSTLPEGVYINAFLDRSELIAKTTFTITENLVLGFLIVIFVVVLLLGNWRSGLVVASVIPLCLLFAISLMHIFDVDANLLSLGAIDFGIIIDGAVIIVEFVAYKMAQKQDSIKNLNASETRKLKDQITEEAASTMMNSAVFGQLIILIVFIPILSLSGVEGKMFIPMALVFSFAVIGAMLLCFTYVPVVSSLFLKAEAPSDKNISVRLMRFLRRHYERLLDRALNARRLVIGLAVGLFAVAVYLFTTMGGEFVPQLDEGDFVIQPILKTGTSLEGTIARTTQIEKILLDSFPEVKQVVSRIGAAEVPTDPMSMEDSDVIITLKDKSEWVSADSKDELAARFKEALSIIPGMDIEFTQPIEMRFNELITGVRADIAIKVFGEDLDILNKKGNEIRDLIENVEGAADISVEKVTGLPQMSVKYNRAKIARYGLNISDLNDLVKMGFAGEAVGNIFEGEKRFDLVVRLEQNQRQDIDNLRNLYVDTPLGDKVRLSELADISYTKGAAKISRDETRRRIVVGVNVRNRDLESVVEEIQQIVSSNVKLPAGYSITYGGQFENLQSATSRLQIAVPVALLLIFIMLYFAFKSVKEALLIFSAIPLSAVGGIFLLWLRGMPFSISAGVGFIALFGIAVLNGIVMLEHFKELKTKGITDMRKLITQGASDRLRAVLLTATAAALGFLPMAVSTNAGAEVQRPLATVVIGGLISATLLTLVVLPVLVSWFDKELKNKSAMNVKSKSAGLLLIFILMGGLVQAQEVSSFEEVRELAYKSNAGLKAADLRSDEANAAIGSAFSFDKTEIYYHFDENNLAQNNRPIEVFGVSQTFAFPTVYFAQAKVNRANYNLVATRAELTKIELEQNLAEAYYRLQFVSEKLRLYQNLDSIYQNFAYAAKRRFELGESNYLEKISAQAKQKEIETRLKQMQEDLKAANLQLSRLVQTDTLVVAIQPLERLIPDGNQNVALTANAFYDSRVKLAEAQRKFSSQQLLPDLTLNYFQGSNDGLNKNLIGYQFGVKIPLFFSGNTSQIKTARIAAEAAEQEALNYKIGLQSRESELRSELNKYAESLVYYDTEGLGLAGELEKTAISSYKNGEVSFFEYIQILQQAYEIKLSYLESVNNYNQAVIKLNYLIL